MTPKDLLIEEAEASYALVERLFRRVADDELANTPFMKALKERPGYTVAQFAQAIGAIHYANHRLREAERRGGRPAP